jgi:hypothetical protein
MYVLPKMLEGFFEVLPAEGKCNSTTFNVSFRGWSAYSTFETATFDISTFEKVIEYEAIFVTGSKPVPVPHKKNLLAIKITH